mgnify:CR=1 FL=1|jgi:hypothetical protein
MGFCSEVLQENINTVRLNANINLIIIESFPVNYEENLRVWYGLKNWNKKGDYRLLFKLYIYNNFIFYPIQTLQMSSLYLHELVMLLIGIVLSIFLSVLFILKKNKQAHTRKTHPLIFFIPILLIAYPIVMLNGVQSELSSIKKLIRQIEHEPNVEEIKSALEEGIENIAKRQIRDIPSMKIIAKANFLIGNRQECSKLVEKILEKKPFDEQAQRLQTLSRTIRD